MEKNVREDWFRYKKILQCQNQYVGTDGFAMEFNFYSFFCSLEF